MRPRYALFIRSSTSWIRPRNAGACSAGSDSCTPGAAATTFASIAPRMAGYSSMSAINSASRTKASAASWPINASAIPFSMFAPSGDGCVRAAIVSRERAGTPFAPPHARGCAAGVSLVPTNKVRRSREGARRFAWLRGGVLFLHGCSVAAVPAAVSNNVFGVL